MKLSKASLSIHVPDEKKEVRVDEVIDRINRGHYSDKDLIKIRNYAHAKAEEKKLEQQWREGLPALNLAIREERLRVLITRIDSILHDARVTAKRKKFKISQAA